MLNIAHPGNDAEAGALADWRQWLEADGLLSPGLRESYRRALDAFEQFCLKRARTQARSARPSGSARPSVELSFVV
jgi:hypothetical protein